jgi:hypothetical protein
MDFSDLTADQKGDIAELKVMIRATQKGWIASKTVKGSRYDLVLDDGSELYRVQVKFAGCKASHSNGCVQVRLRTGERNGKERVYKKEEVDAVLVYLPHIDAVCWFDPCVFDGKKGFNLRYKPSKNGQNKGVIFSDDYLW